MRIFRIISVLLVLGPSLAFAQEAEDDRGYLQGLIEDALSGAGREVRIEGFSGALSSSAQLQSLTIADAEGVWLTMTDAQLDWRRSALLRGRLEVDRLSAESLVITRLPTSEPPEESGFQLPVLPPPQATPFRLPELPVSIQIGEMSITSVTLAEAVLGSEAELSVAGSASLAEGEGAAQLQIARIDDVSGEIDLSGRYANATDTLALSLIVSEAADGILATVMGLPDRPALDLSVTGEGQLTDFIAEIALRTDGQDRLSGEVVTGSSVTDSGTTEQMFTADLSGDIRPLLQPEYRSFFGQNVSLDLDARRSDQGGLDITTLALQSAALSLNGQVSLSPEAWPERITLRGRIAPVEGNSVLLSIPGVPTRLDRATLAVSYDSDVGDRWALDLRADAIRREGFAMETLALTGEGTIASGEGAPIGQVLGDIALEVAGLDLGDPDLNTAVGAVLAADLAFALVEGEPFRISDLDLQGADYGLEGDILLRLPEGTQSPVITSDLVVTADDLSRFAALAGQPLSGLMRVDLTGDVTPLDGAFDLEIDGRARDLGVGIAELDPLIAGAASVSLVARRDTTGTEVDWFDIRSDQAQIAGGIRVREGASSGAVSAQIFDASLVHPDMQGDGQIAVEFAQAGSRINANIEARAPGDVQVDMALVTPEETGITRLLADVSVGDLSVYQWLADRPIGGALQLTATGEGDLQSQVGTLQLNGTATDLSSGLAEADTLLAGPVEIVLDGQRNQDGTIDVSLLNVVGPRVSVQASGDLLGARSRLEYALRLPDLGVLVATLPGALAAQGQITGQADAIALDSQIAGPGGLQASVAGAVALDASGADLSATGVAPLALINRQIAPNIVEGSLNFDLALNGPFDLSSLSGQLTTRGATLSLPALKLAFSSIDSSTRLSAGRANIDADLAVSTGGRLRVTGPVTLGNGIPGDLSVAIQEMAVIEPGLVETVVNGQITANGPLTGGALIAGQVRFDEVSVQVPSTSGPTSAALPGLEHRNEPAAVRQTRQRAGLVEDAAAGGGTPPYRLDVLVSAPARIFIRGRGLDAEMGGQLRLRGTTNAVVPAGRFELIRGRLSILGQRLDLTQGFIEPQGDLDPYIQIIAEAQAGSTDVRFVIEGPISAPDLVMSSSPELPDDEILSRFLFGRDLTQISGLQALQIADALAQLSGRGPGTISSVRDSLGLDDLDVSTTDTGETNVRAGKYISENIYSDVSRSTDGETEINLNLQITPNLTARGTARSDSSTSLGIFLEKDY